jgi:hypothetical protein
MLADLDVFREELPNTINPSSSKMICKPYDPALVASLNAVNFRGVLSSLKMGTMRGLAPDHSVFQLHSARLY